MNQVGLFVWAQIPKGFKNSYELCDKILYDAKVFITPGGIFGTAGEQFIRISLCANNETLEKAIAQIKANI